MSGQDWLDKDFYKVLGVERDADADAIRKAYRKLARKWHPDQNQGDAAAEERFKEIGEAYAVLSDPEQRKQYDAIRAMASGGARFSAGPGGAGAGFEDVFSQMFGGSHRGGGAGGFEDVLRGLFTQGGGAQGANPFGGSGSPFGGAQASSPFGGAFGGGAGPFGGHGPDPSGFGAAREAGPERGADLKAATTLSFRQSLDGAKVRLTVNGESMTVRVPAGVRDGQKIRLRGKGRAGRRGGAAGDLVVTVHVREHPFFGRDGDDLVVTVPVSFTEATLGAAVEVPLPGGEHVTVQVPAGTSSGAVLRVAGRGVTRGSSRGDLRITVRVDVPRDLSDDERAAVDALARALGGRDVRAGLDDLARS